MESPTARAFKPRLELAAYEKKLGNRRAEASFLEQAIQIDPFMRVIHDQLGDAYVALDKPALALREYEVALAVPIELDRSHMDKKAAERPTADSPEEAEARASLCIKIARVLWARKASKEAFGYLDRAEREAPGTDVVDVANELRVKWGRK